MYRSLCQDGFHKAMKVNLCNSLMYRCARPRHGEEGYRLNMGNDHAIAEAWHGDHNVTAG